MEEAFIGLLLANAGVSAAVGTRINWGRKPQEDAQKPYTILQKPNRLVDMHMRGPSGLTTTRVQIDHYGDTYLSVLAASRAFSAALIGYSGSYSGINFQGIFLDAERDLPAADAGDVNQLFRISSDFIIWHT